MIKRIVTSTTIWLIAAAGVAQDTPSLKTEKEKLSYALGMDLGNQLHRQSVDVDPEVFAKGFKDALSGSKTLMSDGDARAAITKLQNEMRAKQMAQLGDKNKKDGEAFLAQNKSKEGVVTLPSGLQYKILKPGNGQKPGLENTVECHYRGTLIDGTEFDSSYKRNEPAKFPVKGVIKGWTEALQMMPVGSKWQLFIPPDLAYGERGTGPIGPNATLVFEVELLAIK